MIVFIFISSTWLWRRMRGIISGLFRLLMYLLFEKVESNNVHRKHTTDSSVNMSFSLFWPFYYPFFISLYDNECRLALVWERSSKEFTCIITNNFLIIVFKKELEISKLNCFLFLFEH